MILTSKFHVSNNNQFFFFSCPMMIQKRKGPEEESSGYIISKSKQSYFRFRCSFSKTKEGNEAVAAVALKSLGRVKKRPNLSLTILLNLMCRILKSLKIRSFRDSTAYIPRYT